MKKLEEAEAAKRAAEELAEAARREQEEREGIHMSVITNGKLIIVYENDSNVSQKLESKCIV